MSVTSREELKEYCLRKLGYPVVEINVDDQQVEDRIDDAIEHFTEYHFDGVETRYLKHQIVADDITNGYLDMDQVDPSVVSVVRAFQFGSGAAGNFLGVKYQMAFNDFYGLRGGGTIQYYDQVMRHMQMISDYLTPEKKIRFNRVTNKLFLDMDWSESVTVGDYLMFECYVTVDGETYKELYNDRFLKEYSAALIKRQWGSNLSKFEGMQLPGGVQFNGQQMFQDAQEEIRRLEDEMSLKYELPPDFMTG